MCPANDFRDACLAAELESRGPGRFRTGAHSEVVFKAPNEEGKPTCGGKHNIFTR